MTVLEREAARQVRKMVDKNAKILLGGLAQPVGFVVVSERQGPDGAQLCYPDSHELLIDGRKARHNLSAGESLLVAGLCEGPVRHAVGYVGLRMDEGLRGRFLFDEDQRVELLPRTFAEALALHQERPEKLLALVRLS